MNFTKCTDCDNYLLCITNSNATYECAILKYVYKSTGKDVRNLFLSANPKTLASLEKDMLRTLRINTTYLNPYIVDGNNFVHLDAA